MHQPRQHSALAGWSIAVAGWGRSLGFVVAGVAAFAAMAVVDQVLDRPGPGEIDPADGLDPSLGQPNRGP